MTKFSDLKLDPKVLQAIAEAGYENPTPIQAGAIPPALEGRDVLGIAQTGTGKTASFTLPMITLLGRGRARARMPRSLVLCPTRELAAQVAENFDVYAKHTRLTKALLIGGVSFGEQDRLIDRGVDVLIATPGRLLDHFERGKLLLTGVQIMVVDEADRMLDMGFIPDIERIFQLTPFTRQTLFFSATMAPEIERITNTFLHAPERIEVARQATTSETITQKLVELTPTRKDQAAKQKRELLRALIAAEGEALKNAIIFCNRKTEVDIVAKSLKAHGFDAAPIHGDLDQRVRTATLDGFREGTLRFLVASDVAARGLDIPAVSHVVNFDLPSHAEDYVHRIGRTGRAGRLGTAISIATPADEKYLSAIESLVKHALPRAPLPEGFSLSEAAQSAPRERPEPGGRERGGRDRAGSRVRTRGRRRDEAEGASAAVPAPEATVATLQQDRPAREHPAPERRDSAQGERTVSHGAPRADQGIGRGDQRGERRDRGRDRDRADRDRGPAVAGFGDAIPDFMTSNFAEAIAATEARAAAAPATDPSPAPAEAASAADRPAPAAADTAAPAADDAAPRSRSRRGRGRKAAEAGAPAPDAPPDHGENAAPAPDDAAVVEPDVSGPQPAARAGRSRSAKSGRGTAAPQPESDAETAGAQTDARTDAPEAASPAEVAAEAQDKPAKPRRTRARRKTDDAAVLPEEADAARPDMTVAPEPDPVPAAEPLPADALPEERAAVAAVEDGSLGTPQDGDDAPQPVAKPKRPRAPRKPRASAASKAADAAAAQTDAAPADDAAVPGDAPSAGSV